MRIPRYPAILLSISLFNGVFALFGGASMAWGQDPIRVSSVAHPDGSRTETQTDPSAGTVISTTYTAVGTIKERAEYKAGPDGVVNEGVFHDGKGAFLRRALYARDAMGHVVEEAFYSEAGFVTGRKLYVYGGDGRVTAIKEYDANGRLTNSASRPALPVTASGPSPAEQAGNVGQMNAGESRDAATADSASVGVAGGKRESQAGKSPAPAKKKRKAVGRP